MGRFLRALFAIALLPFAWAIARAALDAFLHIPVPSDAIVSPAMLSLGAGFVTFLVAAMALPTPVRLYVLGHELTHALWGLCFFARVSNLRVGVKGGSVQLSKSNVWITLAPYFFPFWTMVVVVAALVTRCFVSPLPCPWIWFFTVGFTWCLHCCFTIKSLCQRQPDIETYGHIFSYTFIWIFNCVGIIVWIVCTSEVTWTDVGHCLLFRTENAYRHVGAVAVWLYESVRALPFLQK